MTWLTDGKGAYGGASFSPNGDKIVRFGHHFQYAGATLNELFIIVIETKEKTCLSEDWDIQLGDAMIGDMQWGKSTTGPTWSTHGTDIYFIATDLGAPVLQSLHLQGSLQQLD